MGTKGSGAGSGCRAQRALILSAAAGKLLPAAACCCPTAHGHRFVASAAHCAVTPTGQGAVLAAHQLSASPGGQGPGSGCGDGKEGLQGASPLLTKRTLLRIVPSLRNQSAL